MKNRVSELRMDRGLTQGELGEALGVSRQTVNSVENGRYLPSLPLAFALGRFFDLPIEKLLEPDEEDVG